MTFNRLSVSLAMIFATSAYSISQAANDKPDEVRFSLVGKNSCAPELKSATTRYGIRLDSSQNATSWRTA